MGQWTTLINNSGTDLTLTVIVEQYRIRQTCIDQILTLSSHDLPSSSLSHPQSQFSAIPEHNKTSDMPAQTRKRARGAQATPLSGRQDDPEVLIRQANAAKRRRLAAAATAANTSIPAVQGGGNPPNQAAVAQPAQKKPGLKRNLGKAPATTTTAPSGQQGSGPSFSDMTRNMLLQRQAPAAAMVPRLPTNVPTQTTAPQTTTTTGTSDVMAQYRARLDAQVPKGKGSVQEALEPRKNDGDDAGDETEGFALGGDGLYISDDDLDKAAQASPDSDEEAKIIQEAQRRRQGQGQPEAPRQRSIAELVAA